MTHNPFHAICKADDLSQDLATKLFVPEASPIWENIQAPINHLIVGPRGAGKTMVLRQLHHQGKPNESTYGYISLYLQISRISDIFRSTFGQDQPDSANELRLYRIVFSDFLCLEILRELANILIEESNLLNTENTLDQFRRLLPPSVSVDTPSELEAWTLELQKKIEQDMNLWSINKECSWKPLFDLPSTVQRIPDVLKCVFPYLDQKNPCLYLLFDESSPIPEACQGVLNRLLHRGRTYCVKLAIRPYEWTTFRTNTSAKIEIDTDVKPLYIQYPDELSNEHLIHMKAVVDRILKIQLGNADLTVDSIFPEGSHLRSGFRAICAASSGNLQNLLMLCSCVVTTATEKGAKEVTNISPATQLEAIVRYSKDYEERNPYEESRTLCQALLKKVKSMPPPCRAIGFQYSHTPQDLIYSDCIPEPQGRLIKPAFAAGFIRNTDRKMIPLVDVPARFYLSRSLLPREGLALDTPIEPPLEIDANFIKDNIRPKTGSHKPPNREKPLKAFLSTSFSDALTQQRVDLKKALLAVQVECKDIQDRSASQFLFSSVVSAIRNSEFTILDATIPRPYTMFEIGICATIDQKARNVICVINDGGDNSSVVIDKQPKFMTKLPIVRYSLDPDRIKQAADDIRSRALGFRLEPSEFSKIAITNLSLKPRRRSHTVYISLPNRPRRKRTVEYLKSKLQDIGWTMIIEEDVSSYSANEFQVAVQCAYTSRVGIIDTTGAEGEPDLLQCYKLGLFVGKNAPWRVLWVEESGSADERPFASVPNLNHHTWNDEVSLGEAVMAFLRDER